MGFRRNSLSLDLENDIITALIISDEFIRTVYKSVDPAYFSDYGQTLVTWILTYYATYHKAPKHTIKSVYIVEKQTLSTDLAENIATYLNQLSNKDATAFNIPYLIDKAFVFFRRKAYENLFTKGSELINAGRVDDAIDLCDTFNFILRLTSQWENPLDTSTINKAFDDETSALNELFKMQGALGELVGTFERGWLIAFLGPMKRGKSFWLQEMVLNAATRKKHVAYINLEMTENGVRDRIYSRLIGIGPHTPESVKYPLMDCSHNQNGTCPIKKMRVNETSLCTQDRGNVPSFESGNFKSYKVCCACRDYEIYKKYFKPAVWFTWVNPKLTYDESTVKSNAIKFKRHFGDNIRIKTYPAYSITIDEIQRDLDELRWTDQFNPDVVVLDYADIIASKGRMENERAHINQVWKQMKGAAQSMHALWITASQTNRSALDRKHVDQKDIAEDIRKLAHVDLMLSINQTNEEKEALQTRISCIAHRHKYSIPSKQILVLQQLELGQPCIDSETIIVPKTDTAS